MIELMVSLVILAMVSSAFSYGLQMSLAVTREDRARIQATNLAARELEIVRNQFGSSKLAPAAIAATSQVTNRNPLSGPALDHDGPPLDLDGTDFTVVRTVEWLPAGTGTSPCDGGGAVTYPSLGVNVRVSWLENGSSRDVESNTVLTPPKGTLATLQGFIAAKVQGANGTGVEGLPVDITGPGGPQTRYTAGDGCAVFALDAVGNFTVTLDKPGYVDSYGQQSTSKPATVAAGTIQVVPFSYDAAATLELQFDVEGGGTYVQPTIAPWVTLFNASLPTMSKLEISSGTITVSGLWPYPDGYSVWAGTCLVNDPATTRGYRPEAIRPDPGETLTAPVTLLPVQVTFVDGADQPIVGKQVQADTTDVTGCKTGDVPYRFGVTDEDGVAHVALPYGLWTLSVTQGVEQYTVQANVPADGSVTFPLEVPVGGGG